MRLMLLGNPNAGKSSVFNLLTKKKQQVANYPGVTIEAKMANLTQAPHHELIDLPGFYSLATGANDGIEMQLAAEELLKEPVDCLINVINATQLERHLLLTSQLVELGIPMVIVLTHIDILDKSKTILKQEHLAGLFGIPVFALNGYNSKEASRLSDWLEQNSLQSPKKIMPWPLELVAHVGELTHPSKELFALRRLLESDAFHSHQPSVADVLYQSIVFESLKTTLDTNVDYELLMMDARYRYIHQIVRQVYVRQTTEQQKWTLRLDKWVLHRLWGWPIFLIVLWVFFSIAVDVGGGLQVYLSNLSDIFFQRYLQSGLIYLNTPRVLQWLLVNGLGQGVSTMLSFLPVMACMTIFLSLLESSGYMSRVAFLFERIMRRLGLPGKAFLPLLIGFGCNVPAIMAARLVDGKKERLLTVLLSPFMSCSARLTIYAVFASLFFPSSGGLIVLSLYVLGMFMAILTGLILRKFWLSGKAAPVMMELPQYQLPQMNKILREVYVRLKMFLIRSGQLVVPFCMVLGTFQAAVQNGWVLSAAIQDFLQYLWVWLIQPVFSPMGIEQKNWPAVIGLLTGTMAKEIVIATLNTLYSQMPDIVTTIKPVINTHPHMVFFNQFFVLPDDVHLSMHSKRSLMYAFGSGVAAYSYLLFVLLYIPCISTLAIIRQEVGRFWQWFALIWSLWLSYSVATLFYQLATFSTHKVFSLSWCVGIIVIWVWIVFLLHHWKPKHVKSHRSLH